MKRWIHIGMLSWLMMITTGFSVQQHYCMGMLHTSTILLGDLTDCGNCEKEMGMGCCSNVITHFELDSDMQAPVWTTLPAVMLLACPIPEWEFPADFFTVEFTPTQWAIPPPNRIWPSVIIWVQNFRL
ncbi:HYC_CC_PP family protein [Pontibacter sp. G13]|uniref:HYC_CC_PP family protein n=1 Tax=Pontibacter sp. G13 TaxID=3074898 RepID=UPI00288A301E|nr:hypothetical protein [Pontibacter sp. G13]WNJ16446.1 hypothetical protein RJD25_16395 [Pontibacter sp. G13]